MILWILDPWQTLDHAKDTSLRLIQAGIELGVPMYGCTPQDLVLREGRPLAVAQSMTLKAGNWQRSEPMAMPIRNFKMLVYRTDPPVDLAYLQPLQLLLPTPADQGPQCEIQSPLEILLQENEKLIAREIHGHFPPTLAAIKKDYLWDFLKQHPRAVLKPFHLAQSKGITLLDTVKQSRGEIDQILDQATQGEKTPILLQAYLPQIQDGELRLWFLNGKFLASAKKFPIPGDFKVDIDRGSRFAAAAPDAAQSAAIEPIQALLRRKKIRMAAVDLIGDQITDFNFTSPGLLVQLEQITGRALATEVIQGLTTPWPTSQTN